MMNAGYQEISFFEAFPQTCYLEYYKNILADFLMEHFIDDNSNRFFLFTNNENKKIFLLEKKLKATFTKKTFEIPILVYFPENFPSTPPEIYIEKRSDHLEINKKIPPNFIDRNTLRIHFEIIFNWNKTTESIIKLFETLENIFSKHFPIFQSKNKLLIKGLCQLDIKKCIPIIKSNNVKKKKYTNDTSSGTPRGNSNKNINITPNDFDNVITPGAVSFDSSVNDIFSDEDLKNPIIPKLKDKLFNLIVRKQNQLREINLELNQVKNNLNKKLNLIEQVNKNGNMIMNVEKKAKNDFDTLYKNMRIGDYTILDKAESMLMIYNPKTIKRHVMEIVNQDLIREIKRALEKKTISFKEAINNVRTISREIFYLQKIQEMHPNE